MYSFFLHNPKLLLNFGCISGVTACRDPGYLVINIILKLNEKRITISSSRSSIGPDRLG